MTSARDVDWRVRGSYFEACNCDAVCPCREYGGRPGGRSTYGVCQFALSWMVDHGHYGDVALAGREVVLAGWYDDDEPSSPTTKRRHSIDDLQSRVEAQPALRCFAGLFACRAAAFFTCFVTGCFARVSERWRMSARSITLPPR